MSNNLSILVISKMWMLQDDPNAVTLGMASPGYGIMHVHRQTSTHGKINHDVVWQLFIIITSSSSVIRAAPALNRHHLKFRSAMSMLARYCSHLSIFTGCQ